MAVCQPRGKGASEVVLKIAHALGAFILFPPTKLIRFRAVIFSSMDLRLLLQTAFNFCSHGYVFWLGLSRKKGTISVC